MVSVFTMSAHQRLFSRIKSEFFNNDMRRHNIQALRCRKYYVLKIQCVLTCKKYNKALFTWLIVTMINKHHVYIMWLKMTQNQSFVLISWFLKLSPNRWFSFCQIWNQPKHDGLLINGAIPVNLGMIICFERYAKTIDLFFIHNAILIS